MSVPPLSDLAALAAHANPPAFPTPRPTDADREALARLIDQLPENVAGYGPATQDARRRSLCAADRILAAGYRSPASSITEDRETLIEIAAEGISNAMDIDTNSEDWARGAVDALIGEGVLGRGPMAKRERQAAWASLRMVREAIGELFGPQASLESDEAVLLRGPEYHHEAEAQIAALQRVRHRRLGLCRGLRNLFQ